MRLVLTHSGQHFAPKRHARYTPMPATQPRRVVSLLRAYPNESRPSAIAPARSLMDCVTVLLAFASLLPSTSSASLNPTTTPPPSENTRALLRLTESTTKHIFYQKYILRKGIMQPLHDIVQIILQIL